MRNERVGARIASFGEHPQVTEARTILRGDPGSVVRLTVERPGVPAPLTFSLTRREIQVHSVQHPLLLGDGLWVGVGVKR